eukprot:Skav224261  [mRNA]  locus=scaffold2636:162704:164960:- [translate_table: standard]
MGSGRYWIARTFNDYDHHALNWFQTMSQSLPLVLRDGAEASSFLLRVQKWKWMCQMLAWRLELLSYYQNNVENSGTVFFQIRKQLKYLAWQELTRLPQYWAAFCAVQPVPFWAQAFLSSFPWTSLRKEAFVLSLGVSASASENTPDVVMSSLEGQPAESWAEEHEEEYQSEPDMEVDVVEAAMEKDWCQHMDTRDDTPSPERSIATAAPAAASHASSSSSRTTPLSERLSPIAAQQASRRVFKYGECPHHHTALQPHVWSARSAKRGQPALVCSRFLKRGADDKPLCWFYRKVSLAQAAEWPRFHRQKVQSLQNRFLRAGQGE